jgi:DNA-binding NtrC family response regulator
MLEQDEASELAEGRGPLVLVVAPDRTHRTIVSRLVQAIGYRVHHCAAAEVAAALIREHTGKVSLLLADGGSLGREGSALVQLAGELDPRLQVALMVEGDEGPGHCVSGGARDVPRVQKPVNLFELAPLLRRLLGPPDAMPAPPPRAPRR